MCQTKISIARIYGVQLEKTEKNPKACCKQIAEPLRLLGMLFSVTSCLDDDDDDDDDDNQHDDSNTENDKVNREKK